MLCERGGGKTGVYSIGHRGITRKFAYSNTIYAHAAQRADGNMTTGETTQALCVNVHRKRDQNVRQKACNHHTPPTVPQPLTNGGGGVLHVQVKFNLTSLPAWSTSGVACVCVCAGVGAEFLAVVCCMPC